MSRYSKSWPRKIRLSPLYKNLMQGNVDRNSLKSYNVGKKNNLSTFKYFNYFSKIPALYIVSLTIYCILFSSLSAPYPQKGFPGKGCKWKYFINRKGISCNFCINFVWILFYYVTTKAHVCVSVVVLAFSRKQNSLFLYILAEKKTDFVGGLLGRPLSHE